MSNGHRRRGHFQWRTIASAGAALLVVTLLGAVSTRRAATAEATAPTGAVPSSIVDRYLTVRPSLGDVTVVSIASEPAQRKLLAATLQGVVNRTSARIYLVGARSADQDQRWLDHYVSAGLVHVVAHVNLDDALAAFKGEIGGFVVGDYSEPWTINTATSVAALHHGLVATPDEVSMLEGLGLHEIDNHVGRWPDATTAYEAVAAQVRSGLPYQGLAIEQPDQNAPRDFFIQQGVMTIYTRPSQPDYARVMQLLDPYPTSHPVYGYVADDGNEEVQAIIHLSSRGRFLVPTDTTDNLSFHIAVAAQSPRTVLQPDNRPVEACKASDVNVVIATSDGDNMVIPEAYLPSSDRWGSPARGTVPIGWGISPAAAVLMPAIWDYYAGSTGPNDEIVSLLGIGYSAPSLMPDPSSFLTDSNRLTAALGIDTAWSLDLQLGSPTAAGWNAIEAANAASGWAPKGMLLNYDNYGAPPLFFGGGTAVLTSLATDYLATPEDIAARVTELKSVPADQRPLVNFFPATVWSTTYDRIAAAFAPLVGNGVRLLTPRQAWACIEAAGLHPPTTTTTTTTSTTTTTTTTATTTVAETTLPATSLPTASVPDARDAAALSQAPPAVAVGSVPAYVG